MTEITHSPERHASHLEARRIYTRILLAIVIGMGISMAIIRLITYLNNVSGDTFLGRVQEAREALPKIVAEKEDLVMVFGSSMVRAGFSARQFDQNLKDHGVENIKSFNFGFGGLNPLFQDYLARRIKEAFQENDRRLKLAVLEFNPFQTTTRRYNGAVPVIDSFLTLLATDTELLQIAMDDPKRGALLFNIRYLRDNVSAEMITSHFGGDFRPPRPRSEIPEDEERMAKRDELLEEYNELFDQDYPDWGGEQWNYGWQGAGTIPEERAQTTVDMLQEIYALGRSPRRMENDFLNRVHCCDIVDLHFQEELIAAYVRIIKEFQQFSDHVEVIMLPRNTEWIQYPPEARERLNAVLARLEAETGIAITDFQEIDGITPELYSDTTHLARYSGDVRFTEFLAEQYAPILRP